ncbi:MAG: Ca2+-dependent phosphoinositide-specific phospholipase C, partial [Dehalococcoidia bacterium]
LAAIESGAQIISTDYPVPDLTISEYVVRLPNERSAACNPISAPQRCAASDIENTRGLRHRVKSS